MRKWLVLSALIVVADQLTKYVAVQFLAGGKVISGFEKIKDKEIMKKLIAMIIKQGVKYFAINYFFKKCENNHYLIDNGYVVRTNFK
jgi:hypothetical protein